MLDIGGKAYLDANEACALLGVRPATLYAYVSRGRLRSYRQGIRRRRLYLRDEIEALLHLQPVQHPRPGLEPFEYRLPRADTWIGEL